MKAREKLLITLSLLACGVAIGVFALVSLGHFIYTPNRSAIPVVGRMYESTVHQVALLDTVPVPQKPKPVTTNSTLAPVTPPVSEKSANHRDLASRNKHYTSRDSKNTDEQNAKTAYFDLKKAFSLLFGIH